jgi:hypothetical protein
MRPSSAVAFLGPTLAFVTLFRHEWRGYGRLQDR